MRLQVGTNVRGRNVSEEKEIVVRRFEARTPTWRLGTFLAVATIVAMASAAPAHASDGRTTSNVGDNPLVQVADMDEMGGMGGGQGGMGAMGGVAAKPSPDGAGQAGHAHGASPQGSPAKDAHDHMKGMHRDMEKMHPAGDGSGGASPQGGAGGGSGGSAPSDGDM